jgi:hypothetical protein
MSTSKSSSSLDVENETADVLLIVPGSVNTSLLDTELTGDKIHNMLKKKTLKIVDSSKSHTAECWRRFGFPAAVDESGNVMKKFISFVSCKNCFVTYSFKSNSTSQMNKHKCENSPFLSSSTSERNSQSLKQSKIASYASNSPQAVKLKECERNKIKNLLVQWVCTDIRPFSVVNDNGLRSLIQECISLGIFYLYKYFMIYSFML